MTIQSSLAAHCWWQTAVAAAALALVSVSATAAGTANIETVRDGTLGVYADAQATQRCATIAPGSFTTLYVVATLGGATGAGITGAEFRIEVSNPNGWLFQFNPPNVPVVIGQAMDLTPNDPTDRVGINIAFPVCQTGPRVALGTLNVFNLSGGPTQLSVKRRNIPSNPGWACPLFTVCDAPMYSAVCMDACTFDALGGAISATMSLNDLACLPTESCATDCPGAPCVTIGPLPHRFVCEGESVDLVATAVNCGTSPEDIDVFVDYELAGSFSAVAPGQTVTVTHTVPPTFCAEGNRQPRHNVGAVARNNACLAWAGAERQQVFLCDSRVCGGNVPPDCSNARASVAELWPPDGRLVPVTITGVVDPNGGPVQVYIRGVRSDESPGYYPAADCFDAVLDGPASVRLRAEREPLGNGRVYTVEYEAQDPSTLHCRGEVQVCVPRKPGGTCIGGPAQYDPTGCMFRWIGDQPISGPIIIIPFTGGVEVSFATETAGPVEIEVFDIRGRRVAVLAQAAFAPGPHTLQWDGHDADGRVTAAGVYLFRARIDGTVYTRKSVLVR